MKATRRLAHESTQLFVAAWQHFMLVKTAITILKVRSHHLEFKMLMVAVLRWKLFQKLQAKGLFLWSDYSHRQTLFYGNDSNQSLLLIGQCDSGVHVF